ncbi:MAG: copper resistance protein B [Thermohalobaculum sp.]|nr:copper resistance protein B [Thermohalobaculum sp.]
MRSRSMIAGALASAILVPPAALAEPLIWGVQVEQLEYRLGEGSDILAWDGDATVGTDELRLVWRSEGEYALDEDAFEKLENQARLQTPVSEFFDAVVGVRVSTPDGPDRVHGVVGLHGLAPQWFEIDADLFLSDEPFARLEADYEALLTNRVILTPSVEVDLPFTDDPAIGVGGWGPTLEVGARLSYDLVDRAVAPYVGVHYERSFGETADLARAGGEDAGSVYFVAGVRLMF